MPTYTRPIALIVMLSVATFWWNGCTAAARSAAPVAAASQSAAAQPAEPATDDAKDAEKTAEEAAADTRKLAKLERDLAVAREKLAKASLSQDHARAQHADAMASAQRELDLARQRQNNFTEESVPNRIERAQLDLARAEDRAKEAEEELHQLELMYAAEDFADQTKEIVLERGRRRLARSQRDLELRREELAILTDRTIPLEIAEHDTKTMSKAQALEKTRRDAEASEMDKHIAVMSAEAEIAGLEAELQALEEKMAKRNKQE